MTALSKPTEILLASGQYFDIANPESSSIHIEDIAHALAFLCRFTGHSAVFYSVAQHSVLVSKLVPSEYALQGLLHDAAEAYIGDVSKPLKLLLPDYQKIEQRVEIAVFKHFGLPTTLHPSVKLADLIALNTEKRDLMHAGEHKWQVTEGVQVLDERIHPVPPVVATVMFLERFKQLTQGTTS